MTIRLSMPKDNLCRGSPLGRLVLTSPGNGPWNMAVDEALLQLHPAQSPSLTLRLYSWSPPCLSLGYFQPADDFDLQRCAQAGITVVRRPTGGGAVLHQHELTYSLVAVESHPLFAGGVRQSYRRIGLCFLTALRHLGLTARLEDKQRREQGQSSSAECPRPSPACFDTASIYELTFMGKKLLGSAQVRRHRVFLQQGTLPLNHGLAIHPFLRSQGQTPGESSVTLDEALGRPVAWTEVAQAVIKGFQTELGLPLPEAGGLSPQEEALAQHLAREKYSREDWNLGR